MAGFPKYPRVGEAWDECPICGNQFPLSQMRPHYKKGFLVDALCDDQMTHADYMEFVERGDERGPQTDQRVSHQGQESFVFVELGGAGGSGAGGGGAGS